MNKYILGVLLIATLVISGALLVKKQKNESNLAAVSTTGKGGSALIKDDTGSLDGNPLSPSEYAEFEAFMAADTEVMTQTSQVKPGAKITTTNVREDTSNRTEYITQNATPCTCPCPYGKVIIVLGIKSKPGDADYKWFSKNFPSAELIPLGKSAGDAKIAEIKKKVSDYINNPNCPKQKLLLIGYSLGAAIVKDLKKDCKDCADIIAIDPPYPSRVCTKTLVWISKPFSSQLRQICRGASSALDENDLQISWTAGNSLNPRHYPWRNLSDATNIQRLADLKATINKKINDCKAPTTR